jgi:NAD(P)-dependent dehydrogenase (short-subunit alcohol dehydrogenase family)
MTDPIAIITGAGSGIGRRTALALWDAGYSVVLAGRRADALDETIAEAGVEGSRALAVPTDVSDPAAVENLFAQTVERFGRLDLLFNNAGMSPGGHPLEEYSFEAWQATLAVNLTGTWLCIQAAFKQMKAQDPQGGRIINNGSLSAQRPRPQSAPYVAAKHAINGLTKVASVEGRAYQICVGQIDIGNAATDMTERMSAGVLQANGERVPEPTMNADNIAQAVVYMASLPLDTNVPFITVMANEMPFWGRG